MTMPPLNLRPMDELQQKPRSRFRRVWRGVKFVAGGPVSAIGIDEITSGARLIGQLSSQIQQAPQSDGRLQVDPQGTIDLQATAFNYGISVEDLIRRIDQRRRQTKRSAYALFGLGICFLLVWLWEALHMALSSTRVVSAIEFLPFCVLFFLVATKSAWMNWQLRTRRVGSLIDYLKTSEPFLPR